MKSIESWIDEKLKEIALKLPQLAHHESASFNCGYNAGYKNAILDLEKFLHLENID